MMTYQGKVMETTALAAGSFSAWIASSKRLLM